MDSSRLHPFKELMERPGRPDYESVLEVLLEEIFAERGCLWLEKDNELKLSELYYKNQSF